MAKAPIAIPVTIPGYEDVESGIVKWPLSVLRIRHKDEKRLIDLAEHILKVWRDYTDEDAFIYAYTDGEPHNTITPIARKVDDTYELDLTLRNNITTEEHPLGVYHPHAKLHHIKKENIGLIEVMGLAVLPARLKQEMALLKEYILTGKDIAKNEDLAKHAEWVAEFLPSLSFHQQKKTLIRSWNRRSARSLYRYWRMQASTNGRKKVMLPSYVLYRLCNFGNFSTCQAEGFPLI